MLAGCAAVAPIGAVFSWIFIPRANTVERSEEGECRGAVRGSPDPAHGSTEGLQDQRFTPIQGDLRSGLRRGQETRAERFVNGIGLSVATGDIAFE